MFILMNVQLQLIMINKVKIIMSMKVVGGSQGLLKQPFGRQYRQNKKQTKRTRPEQSKLA